jgi:probable O-glycosylation ligase (exosortase A-associated)
MKGLIFTYLLTYGGSVAALIDPFYGLLVYVAFGILRPEGLWYWSLPGGGNYSRIVAIGLLVGWVLHGLGKWEFGRAGIVVFALIGYFAWSALSAPFAIANTDLAWMQVEEYAKIVLPFLVGITTIRSVRQLKQLMWVIVVCEGYLAYEFNMRYLYDYDFDPNGFTFESLDRNGIAITMVTSLGLAGFLGLYAEKLWQRLLVLGLAGLMVHVVLFSMSRGGMLALIVTAGVAFLVVPKKPAYVALFALGLIIGLRLAGPQVWERFGTSFASGETGEREGSAQSRLELWTACFNVMVDHPVFGIGSNNWRLVAHLFGFNVGKDAHTMWLHVGAELGFTGLGLLLLFYGSCVWRLWKLGRPSSDVADPWYRYIAHMVIASIAGFAVSAQFVSVYGVELPFYIVLLGAGTLKLASCGAEDVVSDLETEPVEVDEEMAAAHA